MFQNVSEKSKEEGVFLKNDQFRHDHLLKQLNEEICKEKINNFNLMTRLQAFKDELLKEVKMTNEVIICQEKKMVEDFKNDFTNTLSFFF